VHTWFTTAHVETARAQYPGCRVVVHPECTEEVVLAADAVGSTNFIARTVDEAKAGSVIFVGTEINMVHRLGLEYPEKTVLPLSRSMCPNMYRIDPENLLETLRTLETTAVPVRVPDRVKVGARLALQRMLAVK
jgi:quinolinate synthase